MSGTAVFFQTVKLLIRMLQQKLYRQKRFARVELGLHSTERPYMSNYFQLFVTIIPLFELFSLQLFFSRLSSFHPSFHPSQAG